MAKKEIKWEIKQLDIDVVKPIIVGDEELLKVGDVFIRSWEIGDLLALFPTMQKVVVFLNAYKGAIKYRQFEHDIDTYVDETGKEIPFTTKGIARNYIGFIPTKEGEEVIKEKTKQILFG